MEREAEKKRQAKRQAEIIKRWTRLIQGLRIRERLLREYGDRQPATSSSAGNDTNTNGNAEDIQLDEVSNLL